MDANAWSLCEVARDEVMAERLLVGEVDRLCATLEIQLIDLVAQFGNFLA